MKPQDDQEDLEERTRLLEETNRKIEVLEKQVEAKEKVLDALSLKIDNLNEKYSIRKSDLDREYEDIVDSIRTKQKVYGSLELNNKSIQATIKHSKEELATIRDEIRDAKRYAKEQEEIASNTVSEWNATLVEFRAEADLIQQDKTKLSADIIRLEQTIGTLNKEI